MVNRPSLYLLMCLLLFLIPTSVLATTLDEIFSDFQKCKFKGFFYSPEKAHPYFSERNLKPYKEIDGVYYFKVNDTLLGLPVVELIVPGTWDLHLVTFDVPLSKSRAVFKKKFGSTFSPSTKTDEGEAPALVQNLDSPTRSSLYCNELEGGF